MPKLVLTHLKFSNCTTFLQHLGQKEGGVDSTLCWLGGQFYTDQDSIL